MKKIYITIIVLFFTVNCFSQNFDRNYYFVSTNLCSIQGVLLDVFNVDKSGDVCAVSNYQCGLSYYPLANLKCYKNNGSQWTFNFSYPTYNQNFTGVQEDNAGNVICSGFTNFTLNFNALVSFTGGNFYVKFDPSGIALWAIPRKGDYYLTDNSGNLLSFRSDSTFIYDGNGMLVSAKSGGIVSNPFPSYDNNYFYVVGTSYLAKYDMSGNLIWTKSTYSGTKVIADSSENIYIRSGGDISKADSAGNLIFTRTFTGSTDYAIDKAGNFYIMLNRNVQKYDITGLNQIWNYYSTSEVTNQKIGVDRNYRVSYATSYSSWNSSGNVNPIFFPPNFYYMGGGMPTYAGIMGTRISQDAGSVLTSISAPSVPVNSQHNLCQENPFNVTFSLNAYPVNLPFNPLFKVQLSDSTGSFSSPVIIGQGNYSPISCIIPASVSKGHNYRIKVALSNSSVTSLPNSSGPLKIRKAPIAEITVSDYIYFDGSYYYGCSGTPLLLHANTSPDLTNQFYYWVSPGSGAGYHPISGATNSIYAVNYNQNQGNYAVQTRRTSTGCYAMSDLVRTGFYPSPAVSVTPQGPTTFCAGDSVALVANTGFGLTYQWKKGGTNISGATSDNYTATIGGVYKVREVNSFGCAKLSTGVVVSVPCREEEELNEISGDISAFPNPASGKFTIQSPNENISQINIINLSGQTIYKKEFLSSTLEVRGVEIDLTNQPKGIYMVLVITGKEVYNEKIILQ